MLRQLYRGSIPLSLVLRSLSSAAPEPSVSVSKEALMKLRKRTGYSYVNCRKALVKFGADNITEAEKWLREQAKAEGWAKAAKLGKRATTQGLVAVKSTGKIAAIVELSCETDFVARGENFKKLLEELVESALNYAQKHAPESVPNQIVSLDLDLQSLVDVNGTSIQELVAMAVGELGENITVRNARVFYAPSNSSLYSASHPKESSTSVSMGKFVSVVALKRAKEEGLFPTEKLAAQLCQHVIGMRSETLGEPPEERKLEEEKKQQIKEDRDELNDFEDAQTTTIDEDETALLRQAFMLNPSQTVYEYVKGHQAEIVDFVRSELGDAAE
ncbi:Elongation factor Ts mitochondrial [Trichostrongylus colubriformis]|uniref:Elongation factor Ts, mitochondrial n=1 Tax=Trichostrongylus colubriformis TaxID=6319 RepID=A0AAN8IJE8_TRICO